MSSELRPRTSRVVTPPGAETNPAEAPTPEPAAPEPESETGVLVAPVAPDVRRSKRPRRRVVVGLAVMVALGAGGGAWLAINQLAPIDPIAKAAQTFAGHPRQADIRTRLNVAFAIYGLEATDENYAAAAAALVALRESAVADGFARLTEMDILEGMIADGGLPGSTFPEAAGYSALGLRIFPN